MAEPMENKYNRTKANEILESRIHPLNSWFYAFPYHARRRIEYSFRTTVTTLITLILTYQFGFTPFAAFLSPSNSIASSCLHFGVWQVEMFKAVVASIIGSIVGVIIGFASYSIPLQLVLLFFGLAMLNKCSALDRGQAAYAGQAVLLCGSLVSSQYGVVYTVYSSLMVLIVPYMITGLTLLFVFPASAVFTARSKVIIICRKFSQMVNVMIKAIYNTDYVSLYCAEFDQLQSELETDLSELKDLVDTVNSEKIVFWNIIHLPPALAKLHEILDKMLHDLAGLKDAAKSIQVNRTNEMFIETLRPALEDLDLEAEIAFCIVGEYFDSFEIIPKTSYQWVFDYSAPIVRWYHSCVEWLQSFWTTHKTVKNDDEEWDDKESRDNSPHSIKTREHRGTSSAYNVNIKQMYGVPNSLDLMKTLHEKRLSQGMDSEESSQLSEYRLKGTASTASPTMMMTRDHRRSSASNSTISIASTRKSTSPSASIMSTSVVSPSSRKDTSEDPHRLERVSSIELNPIRSEAVMSDEEGSTERSTSRVAPSTPTSRKQDSDPDKADTRNAELRSDFADTIIQLFASRTQLITAYGKARTRYTAITAADSVQPMQKPPTGSFVPFESSKDDHSISSKSIMLESDKKKIATEHFRLGSRNLNPRDVYLHRLSVVLESVASMQDVFHLAGKHWSIVTFCVQSYTVIYSYFYSCAMNITATLAMLVEVFRKPERTPIQKCRDFVDLLFSWFRMYVNAFKLALSVCIAVSLVLYQVSPQFSLTSAFVILFIRTEYASSAFLKSYQRVEGTVAGAVYAFGCLQIFNCSNSQCGATTVVPLLMAWLAACMLFVEGQRHGYAAYVASYTPMILMIGNTAGTSVAWARIEQTFLGVAIYLIIDNLLLPVRTYTIVKESVLQCITATRVMYCDSVFAIDDLINLERLVNGESSDRSTPLDDYTTLKKRSNSTTKFRFSTSGSGDEGDAGGTAIGAGPSSSKAGGTKGAEGDADAGGGGRGRMARSGSILKVNFSRSSRDEGDDAGATAGPVGVGGVGRLMRSGSILKVPGSSSRDEGDGVPTGPAGGGGGGRGLFARGTSILKIPGGSSKENEDDDGPAAGVGGGGGGGRGRPTRSGSVFKLNVRSNSSREGSVPSPISRMVNAAGASGTGTGVGSITSPPPPPPRERDESNSTIHSLASKLSQGTHFVYRSQGLDELKEIVERRRQNAAYTARTIAGVTIERHRAASMINVVAGEDQPLIAARTQQAASISAASDSNRRGRRASRSESSPVTPTMTDASSSSARPTPVRKLSKGTSLDFAARGMEKTSALSPVNEIDSNRESEPSSGNERKRGSSTDSLSLSRTSTPKMSSSRSNEQSLGAFSGSKEDLSHQTTLRGPLEPVLEVSSTEASSEASSRRQQTKTLEQTSSMEPPKEPQVVVPMTLLQQQQQMLKRQQTMFQRQPSQKSGAPPSPVVTSPPSVEKPLKITPPGEFSGDFIGSGSSKKGQGRPPSPFGEGFEDYVGPMTISMKFTESFIQCNVHLADAEDQLKLVNTQLSTQAMLLSLVIHEPELCYKKFPLCEYEKLLHCFKKVNKSGRSVNEGCQQFSIVLVQMIDKQEDVSMHLNMFAFMSNQLFLITEKVDDALSLAYDALERVYLFNDFDADLSAISVLSQYTETLLTAVDEHFRQNFLKQAGELMDMQLNPYFLLAWVNVFESMRYLMQHLSELGMALHSIKNVEALMTL